MSLIAQSLQISLTVKDINKALAWYTDVLGFTVQQKHERDGKLGSVSLLAGDVRVLLNLDDGKRGWERVKGEGFSFQLSTTQSIDEIAARIKKAGGTLASEPADMPWGVRMFRLQDPDGYRLSVSSPRPR